MYDRQPTPGKEGRVLITPLNGSAPYYATVAMADEPLEEGTALNKTNLLKDATAALFGLGADAVPDDVYKQIYSRLLVKTEMEIVSYTGTGTSGEDNPNSITFSQAPALIVMLGNKPATADYWVQEGANEEGWFYMFPTSVIPTSFTLGMGFGNFANQHVYGKKSEDGKTFSWYCTDGYPAWQYNYEGRTYYILALYDGGTGSIGEGDADTVTFTINGEPRTVEAGITWSEYIARVGNLELSINSYGWVMLDGYYLVNSIGQTQKGDDVIMADNYTVGVA